MRRCRSAPRKRGRGEAERRHRGRDRRAGRDTRSAERRARAGRVPAASRGGGRRARDRTGEVAVSLIETGRRITVDVNGTSYERDVDARRLLVHFIRDDLDLTG